MAGFNLMQHKRRRDVNVSLTIGFSAYEAVWGWLAGEGRFCDGWCLLP